MNEYKEQGNIQEKEYNTPIPTVNFNGTPNPNILNNQEQLKDNNKVRVRRPQQQNMWNMSHRNGYIGLQILIIILTLSTILGILIGATIYLNTK